MPLIAATFGRLRPVVTLSRALLDLLAPSACRACDRGVPGDACLCASCLLRLPWIEGACLFCGMPVAAAKDGAGDGTGRGEEEGAGDDEAGGDGGAVRVDRCRACRGKSWRFERALAAAEYRGPFRRLVLAHKFHADPLAGRFLVEALRRACRREGLRLGGPSADWVVSSVPSHFLRRLRRGRDPAAELARGLSRAVALPYRQLLRKRRWTPPQVSLSRERRCSNLRRSFAPRRGARVPGSVLLVDDVLTTGTTAGECARVLRKAGARRVVVLAAARSPA